MLMLVHPLVCSPADLCLANCNFASHRTCHNVTPHRCMLFISKAVLILAKHRPVRIPTAPVSGAHPHDSPLLEMSASPAVRSNTKTQPVHVNEPVRQRCPEDSCEIVRSRKPPKHGRQHQQRHAREKVSVEARFSPPQDGGRHLSPQIGSIN